MSDTVHFFIQKFRDLLENQVSPARYYRPRPYRNGAVRFRRSAIEDFEERRSIVENIGLILFLIVVMHINVRSVYMMNLEKNVKNVDWKLKVPKNFIFHNNICGLSCLF